MRASPSHRCLANRRAYSKAVALPLPRDEATHRLRCASLITVSDIKIAREVASAEEYKFLCSSLRLEGDLARRSLYPLSPTYPHPALWGARVEASERSGRNVEAQ